MKVISDIQPMTISEALPQGEINKSFAWLISYLEDNENEGVNSNPTEEALKLRTDAINAYGVSESQVKQRRCYILPDEQINSMDSQGPILFPDFPDTSSLNMAERMDIFKRVVDQLMLDYYEDSDTPDHIIHVSNSGYSSPNAVQKLVSLKGWNTLVTNCYHMGCYAAFPAVRMGLGFLSSFDDLQRPIKKLDIVHTELLTLHFGKAGEKFTASEIVSHSLFVSARELTVS